MAYSKSTFSTVHFGRSPFTCSGEEGEKSLNDFRFGTSIGRFQSDCAASTEVKGLITLICSLLYCVNLYTFFLFSFYRQLSLSYHWKLSLKKKKEKKLRLQTVVNIIQRNGILTLLTAVTFSCPKPFNCV